MACSAKAVYFSRARASPLIAFSRFSSVLLMIGSFPAMTHGSASSSSVRLVVDRVADQGAGLRDREHPGQQVMQFDDLDAALAHLAHEVEVVTPGVLHPYHVIKQQVVAVAGGQALMSQARGADQDLPQLADFGIHAVLRPGMRWYRSFRFS